MDPMKMSMQEKNVVIALAGEGLSNHEISRRMGRSEGAVHYMRRAAAALGTGITPERKRGTGRKKKMYPRTDKMLEREVERNPFLTTKELKEMYYDVFREASLSTIQHRRQNT